MTPGAPGESWPRRESRQFAGAKVGRRQARTRCHREDGRKTYCSKAAATRASHARRTAGSSGSVALGGAVYEQGAAGHHRLAGPRVPWRTSTGPLTVSPTVMARDTTVLSSGGPTKRAPLSPS